MRPKSKYRNIRTEVDGITFASRREADYYVYLRAMKKAGKLEHFERQMTYILPGGIKYRADFLERWPKGRVVVTDVKGFKTPVYKLKKKLMKAIYGIEINEV